MLVGLVGLSGNQLNALLGAGIHILDHLGVGRGQRIQIVDAVPNGLNLGWFAARTPEAQVPWTRAVLPICDTSFRPPTEVYIETPLQPDGVSGDFLILPHVDRS